uniref:Uncharacterized protein n=1 Tax=Anopheles aquasalis TaxID=42839 RepID=T1E8C3_ANOAQ
MFRIVWDGRNCCALLFIHARTHVCPSPAPASALTNPLPGASALFNCCFFSYVCPGNDGVYLCPPLKLLITSSCNLYFSIISMKITTSHSCVS